MFGLKGKNLNLNLDLEVWIEFNVKNLNEWHIYRLSSF